MIGYTLRHRVRFVQYTAIGLLAFGFDLALLYAATTYLAVPYIVAVPTAFVIATSTHYALLRLLVYRDTARPLGEGYALFLLIMCTNAAVITLMVSGLVEYGGVSLYPARVGVGALFGLISFFLNSRYNFKVV